MSDLQITQLLRCVTDRNMENVKKPLPLKATLSCYGFRWKPATSDSSTLSGFIASWSHQYNTCSFVSRFFSSWSYVTLKKKKIVPITVRMNEPTYAKKKKIDRGRIISLSSIAVPVDEQFNKWDLWVKIYLIHI